MLVKIRKIVGLICALLCLAHISYAQELTLQDSVRLVNTINEEPELNINRDLIDQIDFGSGVMSSPYLYTEKSWLSPDATLPISLPDEIPLDKRKVLTLRPYNGSTPYNWDPIRQKKIKVTKDTWRDDPYYEIKMRRIYSNWAKNPFDKGIRNSVAEIEVTGLRYNPLAGRVGNAMVGAWQSTPNANGLDLMTPFTKEYWNKSMVKRRRRTLEVLSQYGDSTTVNVNSPIIVPVTR